MAINDWYHGKPVQYADKRIPSNGDQLLTKHTTNAVVRYHQTEFASVVYAEVLALPRRKPSVKDARNVNDLRDMHDQGPQYFFAEFMPWCNHWFRDAYQKLDARLRQHMDFAEFVKRTVRSVDWRQVWNSGEITDDMNRMLGVLNTVLVARMVIEEVIDPNPIEDDTFTWPI